MQQQTNMATLCKLKLQVYITPVLPVFLDFFSRYQYVLHFGVGISIDSRGERDWKRYAQYIVRAFRRM